MAELAPHESAAAGRSGGGRHGARLLAVQALYQIEVARASAESVVAEFERHRLKPHVDGPFFASIVRDAAGRQAQIDDWIAGALPSDWSVGRLELVLLAVVRAAVSELSSRRDVPPRVTISEYVGIAHAFLDGKGPAMVNAILDRLAHQLRADELNATDT